ncbi:MAG: hypothetical protein U0174_07940 [Polyangiaceae bacterium]
MTRGLWVLGWVAVAVAACAKRDAPVEGKGASTAPLVASIPSKQAPVPAATPLSLATMDATAPAPTVAATLTLQQVYSDCGGGPEGLHLIGTDVFVTFVRDSAKEKGEKPTKEFVFCPSRGADGGVTKPRLQMWENCSSFPSCSIVGSDAGALENGVLVQCGKERIELESKGGRAVLRGSFGEREIFGEAVRLAPVVRTVRHAYVDC